MAIRAMWGFSHLPQKTSLGAQVSGYGLAYNSYGITTSQPNYGTLSIDGNSIALTNDTNATVACSTPVSAFTDMVSPKTIIGFRVKSTYVGAGMTIGIGAVGVNITELGLAAPVNSYVEVVCDRVAKEISFFVNGEFKLKKTSAAVPLTGAQTLSFATISNAGINCYLSDFYFIDDTQDDTPCTRLGPVTVKPLNINSADAPGWVASNAAAPLDVINTPYTSAASLATPLLSSPDTLAAMELGLTGLANATENVKGVMINIASQRLPASAVGIDLGIKLGDVTSVGGTARYAGDAMTYGNSGVFTKLPDGSAWTADKLKVIKLTLKPKPV